MIQDTSTLTSALPTAAEVDRRIGALLRELHLARRLRRLAAQADTYRRIEGRHLARPQMQEVRHAE